MKSFLLSLLLLGTCCLPTYVFSQCVPDSTVPGTPGIYPDSLEVTGCQYLDTVVTFVLPRDTTGVVGGIPVTANFVAFTIDSIDGLPNGLEWECNLAPDCRYVVSYDSTDVDTLGCIRIFGTPDIPAFYTLTVKSTAEFILFGQSNTQPFDLVAPLKVNPCEFEGDCYSISLNSNCEPAVMSITNNVPSNGKTGFSYNWNVSGNNGFSFNSPDENPADLILSNAGEYYVSYQAQVDTIGYFLTQARIDAINCSDPVDAADLYWYLISPNNDTLVNTRNNVLTNGGNSVPILTGITSGVLDSGTYDFQVWDQDNFPFAPDDGCATGGNGTGASLNFSIPPSRDDSLTITNSGLTITLFFDHPVQTIGCLDTVAIFPTPDAPALLVDGDTIKEPSIEWCTTTILELAAEGDSIEWYLNGIQIPSTDGKVLVDTGGNYEAIRLDGQSFCPSVASAVNVIENEIPAPAIVSVADTIFVGSPNANYTYTWFNISGVQKGTGNAFTPDSSELYYAIATEIATSCNSIGSDTLRLTLTSIDELLSWGHSMKVFPNPAQTEFVLEVQNVTPLDAQVQLVDLVGRVHQEWKQVFQAGQQQARFALDNVADGMYLVRVNTPQGSWMKKLVVRQ